MASLYEINAAIMGCVDLETGEIIDEEQLQALQMEREQKIENVALWYKNLLSDAEQYKAEKDAFAERERAARAKADSLKRYLLDALQGEKYKSTRVNISYRNSSSVIVDDVLNLPPRFVRFAAPEPNKTEIAAAIKNGEEVNGAHIESRQSIIIK
jgi:hypothetical protein